VRQSERNILRLIIITPLLTILLVIATATYLYVKRIKDTYKDEQKRYIKEYIASQKLQSENWVTQTIQLLEYSNNQLENNIKKELKQRVDIAYDTASYIQEKYNKLSHEVIIKRHISDSLKRMVWQGAQNSIWITDYRGNNILSASKELENGSGIDYQDADGRSIVLEQIQMVHKNKEGFITTRVGSSAREQIMYVKDFGHYDWYIGSGVYIDEALKELKETELNLIRSFPTDDSGFIGVFDGRKLVYVSRSAKPYMDVQMGYELTQNRDAPAMWSQIEGEHLMFYSQTFEPFGWTVVYGFDRSRMDARVIEDQKRLEQRIVTEMWRIAFGALAIGIVSVVLSLFFSRRITSVFRQYQDEVNERELWLQNANVKLQQLNDSLEQRVTKAVHEHQEKEKMLIQQSKMAEMGDMISMIAHQWRQPLNQMSYLFMNIEGAFEYKELTKAYLEEKISEGTKLLEFMSHTIDDFRNFFRPDKERTELSVSEVVQEALLLIEQTLEVDGISLNTTYKSHSSIALFRNELIQVIINLVKNAKEALLHNDTPVPVITIQTLEGSEHVYIEVSDNGGGVDEAIMLKIFDPYFSTKGSMQGTGLGLYMSKTIIEGHLNGTLQVQNRNDGACFIITISKSQVS
jgi:signal transduction histidine kinase